MIENSQLVPVFNGTINGESQQLCNARELHGFLQSSQQFSDWIKNRIEKYGFVENVDFIFHKIMKNSFDDSEENRGRQATDYHITLDMAKELAMVERNDMGRQVRRYFIECEKRYRNQISSLNFNPEKQVLLPRHGDYIELYHLQWLRDEIGRCQSATTLLYKTLIMLQSPTAAEICRLESCLVEAGRLCNFLTAGIKEFERNYPTTSKA